MDAAENAFSCKICYSVYDDHEKKPYIISPCSHTICIDCLREILDINSNCPFCKKEIKASINEMKPNYELIDIINTIRSSNNDTRCVKCSDLIDAIYFKEKNNNIQFLCKKCAKEEKINNEDDSNFGIRLDDFITNSEKELICLREILTSNLNKENLKKISRDAVVDFLKKTLCDLIDQKKDQLSSFLDSSDYYNYIHRYNKSLEKILTSRENSIKYLQANSTSLKNTTKDQIIHNILNVKNQSNDVILNQKIKNFKDNFHKEFSKNNFYIHNILSTIMNDIVYHSNIALMNSIKECLREDFGLLDKISEPINLPGIQNFQNNGIQTSYLLTQNFMRNENKNFDNEDKKPISVGNVGNQNTTANCVNLINLGSTSSNTGINLNSNSYLGTNTVVNSRNINANVSGLNSHNSLNNSGAIDFNNHHINNINSSFSNLNLSKDNHFPHYLQNSLIHDSYFIQVIGLKISAHPIIDKLSQELKEHFKCPKVSIIKLNDHLSYGTRIFFDNEEFMNKIMNSGKTHKVILDNILVKLKKKQSKEGNRLYAIYLDTMGKKIK